MLSKALVRSFSFTLGHTSIARRASSALNPSRYRPSTVWMARVSISRADTTADTAGAGAGAIAAVAALGRRLEARLR
jgi:hypothetical protein